VFHTKLSGQIGGLVGKVMSDYVGRTRGASSYIKREFGSATFDPFTPSPHYFSCHDNTKMSAERRVVRHDDVMSSFKL